MKLTRPDSKCCCRHPRAIFAATVSVCTYSWSSNSALQIVIWLSARNRCHTICPLPDQRHPVWNPIWCVAAWMFWQIVRALLDRPALRAMVPVPVALPNVFAFVVYAYRSQALTASICRRHSNWHLRLVASFDDCQLESMWASECQDCPKDFGVAMSFGFLSVVAFAALAIAAPLVLPIHVKRNTWIFWKKKLMTPSRFDDVCDIWFSETFGHFEKKLQNRIERIMKIGVVNLKCEWTFGIKSYQIRVVIDFSCFRSFLCWLKAAHLKRGSRHRAIPNTSDRRRRRRGRCHWPMLSQICHVILLDRNLEKMYTIIWCSPEKIVPLPEPVHSLNWHFSLDPCCWHCCATIPYNFAASDETIPAELVGMPVAVHSYLEVWFLLNFRVLMDLASIVDPKAIEFVAQLVPMPYSMPKPL